MGNGRISEEEDEHIARIGAFFFGAVVGCVTGVTLQHLTQHGVSDIAAVVAAVGGAAISKWLTKDKRTFGYYCIGLAVAFFFYLICYFAYTDARSVYQLPIPTPTPTINLK